MLEFFRKYQRIFFIFVTVVIIVTFSLFGSYKTMNQFEKRKDVVVGYAIDGSKLKYFDIKQLSALLGAEDPQNGVVGKNLIRSGIAEMLATKYFDVLQSDWQSRLERIKRCRFYVHPASPSLNAKLIWDQLAPGAVDEVKKLQAVEKVDTQFFSSWARLYWMQEQCPSELVRRILFFHQNQYQLPNDPRILNEDFSLCSFRTMPEWFGNHFYDLMVQFIFNAAIEAEQQGFSVTKAEAEADLVQRFSSKGTSCEMVLRSVGLQKNDAVNLWQKVMLFLRYFEAAGQAVADDHLDLQQFSDFMSTACVLDVYQLPKELQFRSLDDLLLFETYLKQTCASCDSLFLPTSMLSVDEVKKQSPKLVASTYQIQCKNVDRRSIESRLSMREVWDWQLQDAHWNELVKAFLKTAHQSEKDRFQVLENLDPTVRSQIDDWSRQQIVLSHPEWMEQEFAKTEAKNLDVLCYANEEIDGLPIREGKRFHELLESALSQNEEALQTLKCYQEDHVVWQIVHVEKKSDWTVLSYQEALAHGRINPDLYLEEEYRRIRNENPSEFQNENGDWLTFGEAKEGVIRHVFAPLFFAIDCQLGTMDHTKDLDFYAQNRFYAWMQYSLESLRSENQPLKECLNQWKIEKRERTIERTSNEDWMMQEPFKLQVGQWSDVYVPSNGEIVFFFVKDQIQKPTSLLNPIQQRKAVLAGDAQRYLAKELAERALKKQAIVLPIKTDSDDNL